MKKPKIDEDIQLEGQMSIFDFPVLIPQDENTVEELPKEEPIFAMPEPITVAETVEPQKHEKVEYGYRGCAGCEWFAVKEGKCKWAVDDSRYKHTEINYSYPKCGGHTGFMPDIWHIPHMCGNCKWSNMFAYRSTNEYVKDGVLHRDGYKPIEEPNIYCLCHKGCKNRRTEYKDLEWEDFGVGHWHRQHEWDTCDNWELDPCFKKYLTDRE